MAGRFFLGIFAGEVCFEGFEVYKIGFVYFLIRGRF